MSQKALVSILCAACVLLSLGLAVVSTSRSTREVYGETGGVESGRFVLATVVSPSGNRPALFVLDTESEILASYETTNSSGIELKGIRRITWDLQEHFEWPDSAAARQSSVRNVKEKVEETIKKRAAAAARAKGQGNKTPKP